MGWGDWESYFSVIIFIDDGLCKGWVCLDVYVDVCFFKLDGDMMV